MDATTIPGRAGLPIDIHGGPTIDPTKNVLDLVRAEAKRQDDLRESIVHRIDTSLETFKDNILALIQAHDKRYEQRHEASEKALDAAFEAQKDAVMAQLAGADRAVSKSESGMEKRFEAIERILSQIAEQQRNLMPRSEVGVVAGALTDKITALELSLNSKIGAADVSLNGKISALEKQLDALNAERQGIKGGYGYAVGVVGFLLAIGSLIMIGIKFIQATP